MGANVDEASSLLGRGNDEQTSLVLVTLCAQCMSCISLIAIYVFIVGRRPTSLNLGLIPLATFTLALVRHERGTFHELGLRLFGIAKTFSETQKSAVAELDVENVAEKAPVSAAKLRDNEPMATTRKLGVELAILVAYLCSFVTLTYSNNAVARIFPYPSTITSVQFAVSSSFALASRFYNFARRGDPCFEGVTFIEWTTCILPLSGLFAMSFYASNYADEILNDGYIQMLKPAQGAVIALISSLVDLEVFDFAMTSNLILIFISVALASLCQHELRGPVSLAGLAFMAVSTIGAAVYAVGLQCLMQRRKLHPTTILALISPITTAMFASSAVCEWQDPYFAFSNIPPSSLVINLAVAIAFEILRICVIGTLSALSHVFADFTKGVVVASIATLAFHERTSPREWIAYTILMTALCVWCARKLMARLAHC